LYAHDIKDADDVLSIRWLAWAASQLVTSPTHHTVNSSYSRDVICHGVKLKTDMKSICLCQDQRMPRTNRTEISKGKQRTSQPKRYPCSRAQVIKILQEKGQFRVMDFCLLKTFGTIYILPTS